jgi:hypothetical protein
MAPKKGTTNNLNGRPAGVPNKSTGILKNAVAALVENNMDRIQSDLDSMEPKDRLTLLLKLMDFVIPKNRVIDASDGLSGAVFTALQINLNGKEIRPL